MERPFGREYHDLSFVRSRWMRLLGLPSLVRDVCVCGLASAQECGRSHACRILVFSWYGFIFTLLSMRRKQVDCVWMRNTATIRFQGLKYQDIQRNHAGRWWDVTPNDCSCVLI